MLIEIDYLKFKYNPKFTGVLHLGAHYCEEHEDYLRMGIVDQIWVEPCQKAFDIAREKVGNKKGCLLFHCACGESEGKAVMNVANSNEGQSNSILMPDKHLIQHPSVVFTETEEVIVTRLDSLPFDRKKYNFLAMDIQGYEGHALRGARNTLAYIDYVYTEVNKDSVYKYCTQIDEMDELLFEFDRVETKWVGDWGDAFYIRKTLNK